MVTTKLLRMLCAAEEEVFGAVGNA